MDYFKTYTATLLQRYRLLYKSCYTVSCTTSTSIAYCFIYNNLYTGNFPVKALLENRNRSTSLLVINLKCILLAHFIQKHIYVNTRLEQFNYLSKETYSFCDLLRQIWNQLCYYNNSIVMKHNLHLYKGIYNQRTRRFFNVYKQIQNINIKITTFDAVLLHNTLLHAVLIFRNQMFRIFNPEVANADWFLNYSNNKKENTV